MFCKKNGMVFLALGILAGLVGCSGEGTTSSCTLDSINATNDVVVTAKPGLLDFYGWAVDIENGVVPEKIAVKLKGESGNSFIFSYAGERTERPRVSEVLGSDKKTLNLSGFNFPADGSTLPLDNYEVSLLIYRGDNFITCPTPKKLVISN